MNISNYRGLQKAYWDLKSYTCPQIMQEKYNLKENKNFKLSFEEFKDIIENDKVYNKNNCMEIPESFVWADGQSKNTTLNLDYNKDKQKEVGNLYDSASAIKKRAFELGLVSEKSLLEVKNFYHEVLNEGETDENDKSKNITENMEKDSFDSILKMYDKTLKSDSNKYFEDEFRKLLNEEY